MIHSASQVYISFKIVHKARRRDHLLVVILRSRPKVAISADRRGPGGL